MEISYKMTSCNEEILLQVPQVLYKKCVGTLYLMEDRMVWKTKNEDTDNDSVAHLYCNIKLQKVSVPGKKNVILKIFLHSNDRFTFQFLNPGGAQDQAHDLRRVKVQLYKLLKASKEKVDKALEDKNKFLASHPDRLKLYKDLVVSKIITPQEFWANQATKCDWVQELQPQEVGVSSSFLSEIKQLETNDDNLKYSITSDTIESIFKIYPSIKNLYTKQVPTKLTKECFWAKFVQSNYFRKDDKYSEGQDLFTECRKKDDEEMKNALSNGIKDPLLDIASFEDKCLHEGYGLQLEYSNFHNETSSQILMDRVNRQSIRVCKKLNNQMEPSGSGKRKSEEQVSHITKKQKFTYDDLERNNNLDTRSSLNLTNVERYFHGPRPKVVLENILPNDVIRATTEIHREAEQWKNLTRLPSSSLISPEAAMEALIELTPKDTLVKRRLVVPNHVEKRAKNLYQSLCELLHQFWRCFPPTTPQLEEKAYKMHAALTRFQSMKLKPFEDKLKNISCPLAHNPTKHMNQLLEAANQKLNEIRSRR